MKDELGEKIMKQFLRLRAKTYSYLLVNGSEDKKVKCTKNYFIKENLNLKIKKLFQYNSVSK